MIFLLNWYIHMVGKKSLLRVATLTEFDVGNLSTFPVIFILIVRTVINDRNTGSKGWS